MRSVLCLRDEPAIFVFEELLREAHANRSNQYGVTCRTLPGNVWVQPLIFRAPGRVNLIGEHTDYNDGFVMPAAIGYYTWVAAAQRNDRTVEAYSERFREKMTLSLDEPSGPPKRHWSDFIRGTAATLAGRGAQFRASICLSKAKFLSAPVSVRRLLWRWPLRWR